MKRPFFLIAILLMLGIVNLHAAPSNEPGDSNNSNPERRWLSDESSKCLATPVNKIPLLVQSLQSTDAVKNDIFRSLSSHFLCMAIADSDPQKCDALPKFQQEQCKEDLGYWVAFSASWNGKASPEQASLISKVQGLPHGEDLTEYLKIRQSVFLRKITPEAACSQMASRRKSANARERCLVNLLFVKGINACGGIKDSPRLKSLCQDSAIALEALSARDAGRCGENATCRALINPSESSCRRTEARALAQYCNEYLKFFKTKIQKESNIKAQNDITQENQFRKANDLPPYKPGNPFLHLLPLKQMEKYLKQRKSEEASKTKRPPNSAPSAAPKGDSVPRGDAPPPATNQQ